MADLDRLTVRTWLAAALILAAASAAGLVLGLTVDRSLLALCGGAGYGAACAGGAGLFTWLVVRRAAVDALDEVEADNRAAVER